ncbi:hypothetical protein [Roseibium aestuarii]|uniref:PD-(D/E)XK nuclease superfamily protein n=1 Tax=Roseibium aestuarii TaxID=2600299 RepID=A0ABW4JS77_9HYPH|nr:hypothetical protein [Roseibium aestuarii]
MNISNLEYTDSADKFQIPEELCEAVDTALDEVFSKTFANDELFGEALTQVRGPLDSLCKRHGILIEHAIAAAFANAGDGRFEVQTQVPVTVSKSVEALIEANGEASLDGIHIPPIDASGRRVIIDIVVFDRDSGDLHVISVKRGGGAQSGQAAREARKDLAAAGLLLKFLMLSQGLPVRNIRQIMVDWYGKSGVVARKSINRHSIDGHFGIPIRVYVEGMSERLSTGITSRMQPLLRAALYPSSPQTEPESKTAEEATVARLISVDDAPEFTRPTATLADCLAVLPARRQGRQMRAVIAAA